MRRLSVSSLCSLALVCVLTGCAGAGASVHSSADGNPVVDTTPLPQSARSDVQQLIALIDARRFEQALQLADQLLERHPHQADVVFEKGLILRLMNESDRAVAWLQPYESSLSAQGLAALGSAYDESGHADEGLRVIETGLEKFPESGVLYSTKGTVLLRKEEGAEALAAYHEGAERDPTWPSNHYFLSKLLAGSKFSGLSLFHGEIYRNLDPQGARSDDVAQTMMKTIKTEFAVKKDEGGGVSMILRTVPGDPKSPEGILFYYDLSMGVSLAQYAEDGFTFDEILRARASFVQIWWEQAHEDPSALASFLHGVYEAGHLDAYNVWLLSSAAPVEAKQWENNHPAATERLFGYLEDHPLASYYKE